MAGPILETWTMGELLTSFWHNGLRVPFIITGTRVKRKLICLLYIKDESIYPIEFKKTASPGKHHQAFQCISKTEYTHS